MKQQMNLSSIICHSYLLMILSSKYIQAGKCNYPFLCIKIMLSVPCDKCFFSGIPLCLGSHGKNVKIEQSLLEIVV
jgi:hypothetical protein